MDPKVGEGSTLAAAGGDRIKNYSYIRVMHNEIIGLTHPWINNRIQSLMSTDAGIPQPARDAMANVQPPGAGNAAITGGEAAPAANGGSNAVSNFLQGHEAEAAGNRGNPVIRAFETTQGRGLAGFISELSFDQSEQPWEIAQGNRAPIALKVSVTFKPIHDIPMGLDADGMMRSVAYGVGAFSRNVNGDVYGFGEEQADLHAAENASGVDVPVPPQSTQKTG